MNSRRAQRWNVIRNSRGEAQHAATHLLPQCSGGRKLENLAFEVNPDYVMSSEPDWATQQDPVLKSNTEKLQR